MRGGGVVWDMSSACVQGGLPHPLGGYQPNLIMEPHSPAPAWQLHHPIVPKQEPMEEDRNDSGTGSDFHSSSPGSENSHDYNPTATYSSSQKNSHDYNPTATYSSSQNTQTPQTSTYYSTSLISRIPTSSPMGYHTNLPMQLNYHSATPLSSKHMQVPQISASENSPVSSAEKPQTENVENEDPLRRLQLTLEKNGLVPPPVLSPKTSEHSADDDNKSDFDGDECDEQGLRVPRMNSHGKVKTHKCKQCDFVAITKLDFWEHSKVHIKPDKLLTCTRCPFVTEFKHHLEYHLRNHAGSKPFKCNKCSYACVNKSMLNSHMKSHSTVYQYRCADCNYASKYCHSLKLHLRKYTHKPDMVLNPDGTPNPLPIIDVYGTRRGPKQRSSVKMEESDSPSNSLHSQFAHFMLNASPQMQLPFPYHFLASFPNPMSNPLLFPPNLEDLTRQREGSLEHLAEREQAHALDKSPSPAAPVPDQQTSEALDLTKPEPSPTEQQPKSRRKGRAFKLENLPVSESDEEEEPANTVLSGEKRSVTPPKSLPEDKMEEVINNNNNNNNPANSCQYCNISFGDIVLYTIHMGYHGFNDPFTCNMCGEECKDKVSFFVHIARNPHS